MKRIEYILIAATVFGQYTVRAADGVVLIDQNRALAGSLTVGDAPGFPVTISQPGSYQLSGNLNVPDGVSGIEITANHVTLNLNGFTIAGSPHTEGAAAIKILSQENVAIANGTVTGMYAGLFFTGVSHAHVEHVRAVGNKVFGILIQGNAAVANSTASGNGTGIQVGTSGGGQPITGSSLRDNDVSHNQTGIRVQCAATNLIGNTASGNLQFALDMLGDTRACLLANNQARNPGVEQ